MDAGNKGSLLATGEVYKEVNNHDLADTLYESNKCGGRNTELPKWGSLIVQMCCAATVVVDLAEPILRGRECSVPRGRYIQ